MPCQAVPRNVQIMVGCNAVYVLQGVQNRVSQYRCSFSAFRSVSFSVLYGMASSAMSRCGKAWHAMVRHASWSANRLLSHWLASPCRKAERTPSRTIETLSEALRHHVFKGSRSAIRSPIEIPSGEFPGTEGKDIDTSYSPYLLPETDLHCGPRDELARFGLHSFEAEW